MDGRNRAAGNPAARFLLPVRRESILWSKFLFATGGSIIPCATLVFLSDSMLNVSTLVMASHQMTCLLLCLGVGILESYVTRPEIPVWYAALAKPW